MPEGRMCPVDDAALHHALVRAMDEVLSGRGGPMEIRRHPNPRSSTHPSEVLEIRCGDGTRMRVLAKYGRQDAPEPDEARGGVAYEAAVREEVIHRLDVPLPALHGVFREPGGGGVWLFTEWLSDGVPLSKAGPGALEGAARWVARFHAAGEAWVRKGVAAGLRRHGGDWFLGWLRRATETLRRHDALPPWFGPFRRAYSELLEVRLTLGLPSLIHGEFFPSNVLWARGAVQAVDWESAAISFPGLDLAALTDGWDLPRGMACLEAYVSERPAVAAAGFALDLALGRAHWALRWLAELPPSASHKLPRLLGKLEGAATGLEEAVR